jgi:hypothetical protein
LRPIEKNAVAGEQVQVAVALGVIEVLALGPLVDLVEPDGAQTFTNCGLTCLSCNE